MPQGIKKSHAKASKAKPEAVQSAAPDSDASRPSRAGGDPATIPSVLEDDGTLTLIDAFTKKRGKGRPKTIIDMRAYKADKERKRRAAAREAKK